MSAPPPLFLGKWRRVEHVPILVHVKMRRAARQLSNRRRFVYPSLATQYFCLSRIPGYSSAEHCGALGKHRRQRREPDALDLVAPLDGGEKYDGGDADGEHEADLRE